MTVKGSEMSAEDVYLKAGKDIYILSAENRSTTREKENSSSASLGGSIGSSGLTGIRASYGRGREEGLSEEISNTESIIKAEHALSLESGKNTGIPLGYDIPSGKVSGFVSAGKSRTDSDYESVTDQAGIYAGDKGFDISVKDNTHLKGAVIDSKGDADKNTLRTGTLSWEDIENKADYKSGGSGIFYTAKLGGNVNNDTQSSRENSRYDKEPGTNTHNESDKVTETFDGNRIPLNERGLLGVPTAATKGKKVGGDFMRRESFISIATVIFIFIIVLIIHFGRACLEDNFVQDNVAEMVYVYKSLPSIDSEEKNSYVIKQRIVSKFLKGEKFAPHTSSVEGLKFFERYAVLNKYDYKEPLFYDGGYHLDLKKGDLVVHVYHKEGDTLWKIMIIKYDWIWNLGF